MSREVVPRSEGREKAGSRGNCTRSCTARELNDGNNDLVIADHTCIAMQRTESHAPRVPRFDVLVFEAVTSSMEHKPCRATAA